MITLSVYLGYINFEKEHWSQILVHDEFVNTIFRQQQS